MTQLTDVERARDDFRRAYALYPAGLGALRNLAYVEEHVTRHPDFAGFLAGFGPDRLTDQRARAEELMPR